MSAGLARASFARASEALREPAARPDATELTRACYWLVYGRVGFHTLRRDPPFAVRRLAESVAALRQVSRSGEQIHCLKGLAYVRMFGGDYPAAAALLDEARAIDPEAQALKRFLLSNAHACPIDGPGRITVPPHLREYARLEREVIVAGVGSHIELWNKARYEEEMAKVRMDFDRLSLSFARSQS